MSTQEPSFPQLLRWLTGITRPVHPPLLLSTLLRLVNLTLDVVLFGLAAGTVVAVLDQGAAPKPLFVWIFVVAVAKASAYYLEQISGHYVAFKALELLRTASFSALWPQAPAVVSKSRSGDVLTSLTRDVDRIEVVYAHTFAPVVSAVVVPTTIVLVTGASVGWSVVAVPAVALFLALAVVPFVGLRSSMRKTSETLSLRRDLAHNLTDSVFGVEEVVSYGRQQERLDQADTYGEQISRSAFTPKFWAAFRRGSNMSLMLISMIGVTFSALNAGLAPAVVVALAAGSLRLFEGPRGVEDAASYLDHSFAAARRLWHISHTPAQVVDGPVILQDVGDVVYEDVSYSYGGNDVYAVEGLSLTVPAGSHTVFVGPSGSGKSTAIQLLLRYDDPTTGSVSVGGRALSEFTLDSLRSRVVAVSQKSQLLNTSIRENLLLGAPAASEDALWDALTNVHLDEEVRSMPQGLDTPVGSEGASLSGGQVQRLTLARALLMDPQVLVLDEFTANLNPELERDIRAAIKNAAPSATVIEVTHRLESALQADQVVILDQGSVVAVGDPHDLAKDNKFLEHLTVAET